MNILITKWNGKKIMWPPNKVSWILLNLVLFYLWLNPTLKLFLDKDRNNDKGAEYFLGCLVIQSNLVNLGLSVPENPCPD
ncbi:hypothetical protein BpHYR1_043491 [Brachionus plicatilis]|uniref:Uncharacterized protein n=1 Tax=Brachionus plicatilis TaxID=10195 RepID=A0A3M7P5C3_BRAPC|nr:hypothetical protein BpHYR1_043491 [Brachionus plicatilis]